MSKSKRKIRSAGFTLIELLVVISIIAILISLLLPVLAGARETARSVRCLSQLRQVSQMLYMYLDQSDGQFPHHVWFSSENYVNPTTGQPQPGLRDAFGLMDAGIQDTFLTCPTLQSIKPSRGNLFNFNYSMNYYLAYDFFTPTTKVRRLDHIIAPSRMTSFFDGGTTDGVTIPGRPDLGWYYDTVDFHASVVVGRLQFPHNEANNFAFIDGHAESLLEETVLQENDTTAFWRGLDVN